jgi:hypothetical protein
MDGQAMMGNKRAMPPTDALKLLSPVPVLIAA